MAIIDKTEKINDLLDSYDCLLTDKQKKIMEMYFVFDLSLSEIATELNVSRTAVFDLIKRTTKLIEKYEKKLQLLEKKKALIEVIKQLPLEYQSKFDDII